MDMKDIYGFLFEQLNESYTAQEGNLLVTLDSWTKTLSDFYARHHFDMDSHTADSLRSAIKAIRQAANGDLIGVWEQFRAAVDTPLANTEKPFFYFLVFKFDDGDKPILTLGTLNRRTLEAQNVLRSPEFLKLTAAKLRLTDYDKEGVQNCRTQGLDIWHSVGPRPYAIFSDFLALPPDFIVNSYTDGGLLPCWFADDLLACDWKYIARLCPVFADWLTNHGLNTRHNIRYFTYLHTILHDTLGHALYAGHACKKSDTNKFEREASDEFGADTVGFWLATDPQARVFLSRIMQDDELYAMPRIWMLKRMVGYTRRGYETDPVYGLQPSNFDARTGTMFYNAARRSELLTPGRNRYEFLLDDTRFLQSVNAWLEEWINVEHSIPDGLPAYDKALKGLYKKYGNETLPGMHVIPLELRLLFNSFNLPADSASEILAVR